MSIYFAEQDLFPGLKELDLDKPQNADENYKMIGELNANYGGVDPRFGKKQSQKCKDAVSKSRKGVKASDETRAKQREAWKKRKETFISPFFEYHKYKNKD
jgi:hypothetical protein